MQQGMLYDSIGPCAPGLYCIVVAYRLEGALDVPSFVAAWRGLAARHPVLRTSFDWKDRTEPVQVVRGEVDIPFAELDWRGDSAEVRDRRLRELLRSENRRGFDVTAAPLLRLTLARCEETVHELIVAHHHLLLDGSCKPLLFHELFELYESHREQRPPALDGPPPFRRFIEWLGGRDLREAESFWRGELRGFREPTPVWPEARANAPPRHEYEEHHTELDEATSTRLREFARLCRVTLNTIVCGAWALVLGRACGRDDVVFGATVNARPPGLEGADAMLGLFINTLPLRVRIEHASAIADWLRALQWHQIAAREFDFAPLSAIQQWSDIARGARLFDSIVVFENNPGYGVDAERYGSIAITNVRPLIRNSLPLTLRCVPGRAVGLQLLYDADRFPAATIEGIAERLRGAVTALMQNSGDVGSVCRALDELGRRLAEAERRVFQQTVRENLTRRISRRQHRSQQP